MKVLLLGSTGSIGTSTCNCIRRHSDRFELVGLAANSNTDKLLKQINEFSIKTVSIGNIKAAEKIKNEVHGSVTVLEDNIGLVELVNTVEFDILVNALVGSVGLPPTVAALKLGKRVALANKESLVVGGELIDRILKEYGGELIPVDSEHSAILQCLTGENTKTVESIILTASGGPFREYNTEQFKKITLKDALNHPTWAMGNKITIDCATLINKGFETIEAHFFFKLPYDRLRICIHHQSIIHSMVEFHDGAVIAQMGVPDMELPIQYAMSYPDRLPMGPKRLNPEDMGALTFSRPDYDNFPCLRLCLDAGKTGGTAPVVVNAANETAVDLFLREKIPFNSIASIIDFSLQEHNPQAADSLEIIQEIDNQTRKKITENLERFTT